LEKSGSSDALQIQRALAFFGNYLLPVHYARDDSTWVLATDYGGEHRGAAYRTYGFLLVSEASFRRWARAVAPIRAEIGDAREFAYKKMRDAVRQRHIGSFLSAADALAGAWFTVAFNAAAYDSMPAEGAGPLAGWGESNVRKANIVIQNALTLLRFCLPHGGNVFWISDQDSVLANSDMKRQFGEAVSVLSPLLMPRTDVRESKNDIQIRMRLEDLSIEGDRAALTDLCAYADLGAGAMAARTTSKEPLSPSDLAPWESKIIAALTPRPGGLQRVTIVIDSDGATTKHYRVLMRG